jgi:hypothetical protein
MDRRSFIAGSGRLLAVASITPVALSQGLSENASNPRRKKVMSKSSQVPLTTVHRVEADGVNVFYREAGPADAPVALLLHGFPASSFQYRELIPRLADKYRVIAPDLPGFGFTEVPETRKYKYSFDALAQTVLAFTDALGLKRYALYVSTTVRLRDFVWRWRILRG